MILYLLTQRIPQQQQHLIQQQHTKPTPRLQRIRLHLHKLTQLLITIPYLHILRIQVLQQRLTPQPLTKLIPQLQRIHLHLRKLVKVQPLHMILYSPIL